MRKFFLAVVFLAICPLLVAQQTLNNESVIKLVKAGLSDDLIVATVNASPGTYDTSADGLIALKTAGATDKVVAAIVMKSSTPPKPSEPAQDATAPVPPPPPVAPPPGGNKPRVFLQSASKGTNQNAARDQSMEMSKDFERDCPDVKISILQQMADYTVILNHIEVGMFIRDNQIQVANKDGDLISKTKEGGSIAGGVKKACEVILADWAKK
jgi:hypothetical protein